MESAEEEAARIAEQLKLQQQLDAEAMQLNHSDIQKEDIVADKKIARNDPCPCGSGKKYKQCCGKSGPKKGVFAGNGAFAS